MRYPQYKQLDYKDCGPTCLRMIAHYYGNPIDAPTAKSICAQYRNGTTMFTISQGAKALGFSTMGVRLTREQFFSIESYPCLVQWNRNHFVIVWEVSGNHVKVGDPAIGCLNYAKDDFCKSWLSHLNNEGMPCGMALLIEKTKKFEENQIHYRNNKYTAFKLIRFLSPHKGLILQLLLSLMVGSAISLVFPFLAQSIVDLGINNKDINFIISILIGQLALSVGMCLNRYIGSWLVLHISSRVSISMVCFFLEKLMKMKISFFDSKMIGDLLQRIQDFSRIETFLTSYLISILIALVGVIVYSFILLKYGLLLLVVFFVGSVAYLLWMYAFKNKRRKIDYMRFQQISENQSAVIHYIRGMQEIKLNNCEKQKISKWKEIQLKIYDINISGLSMLQLQEAGGLLIDSAKNIIITFICAYWVINGETTIGMMIAITYIIGELNGPLHQLSSFIKSFQEAQISMERINEINIDSDEETDNSNKIKQINYNQTVYFDNVSFRYTGPNLNSVLENITFELRPGTVTAIVGESGSGKSTLLKLLMGFYSPLKGSIRIGDIPFDQIDLREWRKKCSAVLQNGYLFTETIAQNIAIGDEDINMDKVIFAAMESKIHDFIMMLPLRYQTIIGEDGLNLSEGQKQRLYIARAIYRNTPFVFLDEATNALDSCNENDILDNLKRFYKEKTVVIVAHRLSTILNADKILVLKNGRVIEEGSHLELMKTGVYYKMLISKQLYSN